MFEKEIQFITDFNLNKLETIAAPYTLDKLLKADIHPALIKYVSGRLDYMVYLDRKTLLENSKFDYSGPKIADYFNLIADEIKKTKKLSYEEMRTYIEKGVVFNANFSVQPKSTLINLIYKGNEESKNSAEIRVYLNYIYYYDYLREIINSYISKRKLINLSKSEFRSIIDRIDNNLLSARREEIISDALDSISDYYNDGGISRSSIQPALAEAYLKDKGLDVLVKKLQKEIKDNKKKAGIEELKKILFTGPEPEEAVVESLIDTEEEILKDKEEVTEKDITDTEKRILPDFEFEEEKIKDEKTEKEREIPVEKTEPKVEKTEPEIEKTEPEIEKTEPEIEINEPEPDEKKEDEEILKSDEENEKDFDNQTPEEEIIEEYPEGFKEWEDLIEDEIEEVTNEDTRISKSDKKEKDIFSLLNEKEIEKIIGEVFNDDEDDFANTMEKLTECSNYEQASEILKGVFFTYRINPYTREAVTLTNAVSNYFHQGE
jgi:hypothetical protein